MSIEIAPACALGLTRDDLSGWRDGFLGVAERERIRAHVATCAACGERLADFDAIAHELRRQRVPEPDARLWTAVQSAATRPRLAVLPPRMPRMPKMPQPPPKQAWGALGAVAAILLVVVGFARLLYVEQPQQPKNPLVWHEVKMPVGQTVQATYAYTGVGLAPGGRTAYACNTPASSKNIEDIWLTRDAGANWQRSTKAVPQLPSGGIPTSCSMLADAGDSTIVVAIFSADKPGPQAGQRNEEAYVTLDGGAMWGRLPDGHSFTRLATRQGTTYALRMDTSGRGAPARLSISYDRFQSWTEMDDDILAAGEQVTDFWLNPTTREVLAATDKGGLWQSLSGDGKRWTALTPPQHGAFTARSPGVGRPLQICGDTPRQSNGGSQIVTFCSADDGKTWTTLPSINQAFTCGTACARQSQRMLVIGGDGALLVRAAADGATADTGTNDVVYRLLPGAAKWESLGAIPAASVADDVLAAPGGALGAADTTDVLWAFNRGIDLRDGPHGVAGPGAHVYVADYPPDGEASPTPPLQPTPTATSLPIHPLAWRPVHLPNAGGLSVTPSDGNTAYLCDAPSPGASAGPPHAWVTRDRGAHWSTTAALPSRVDSMPEGETFFGCGIIVDDLSPTTAIAQMSWSSPGTGSGFTIGVELATFDAGRSWRQIGLDQGSYQFVQLASVGGVTYALRSPSTESLHPPYHIWASTDQMRTWRRVDTSVAENVRRFWLDPQSGEMLAQSGDANGDWQVLGHLYISRDRGATWTQLNPPAFAFAWAQRMTGSGTWRICTAILNYMGNGGETLNCSDDGGTTWMSRPPLRPSTPPGTFGFWFGLADDGSFLGILPTATGPDGLASTFALYRLGPGSSGQWESLGELPGPGVSYASSPGTGVLWSPGGQGAFTADYPS